VNLAIISYSGQLIEQQGRRLAAWFVTQHQKLCVAGNFRIELRQTSLSWVLHARKHNGHRETVRSK
jgi:hypothetical protein